MAAAATNDQDAAAAPDDQGAALSPKGAAVSDGTSPRNVVVVDVDAAPALSSDEVGERRPTSPQGTVRHWEEMLALTQEEREKIWREKPLPGYAYINKAGKLVNPWLFGIDLPMNRYLLLVAGVLLHFCIGTIYAFSVFNDPINKEGEGVHPEWQNPGYVYALAIFTLGMSAGIAGQFVESRGPRFTGTLCALCWGGGHVCAAVAIHTGEEWLMYVGLGFLGGIGLGCGYVTPVSPMLKWFPDHRGLASGCAVAGFGSGAFLMAKGNDGLITTYGVEKTFWILATFYIVIIATTAQYICKPPIAWTPEGFDYVVQAKKVREGHNLTLREALKLPHFWLCWGVLFTCIFTGVAVFSQAKPLQKDVFQVSSDKATWMLSVWAMFNMIGRVFWPAMSDILAKHGKSRKYIYMVFTATQATFVILFPFITKNQDLYPLFSGMLMILFSIVGGTFGTIPSLLADLFGSENTGAVHGVSLTAWGLAGGVGSISITAFKDYRKGQNIPDDELYDPFFYLGFCFLICGFVFAALLRPLIDKRGNLRLTLGWMDTLRRKWNGQPHPDDPVIKKVKSVELVDNDTT